MENLVKAPVIIAVSFLASVVLFGGVAFGAYTLLRPDSHRTQTTASTAPTSPPTPPELVTPPEAPSTSPAPATSASSDPSTEHSLPEQTPSDSTSSSAAPTAHTPSPRPASTTTAALGAPAPSTTATHTPTTAPALPTDALCKKVIRDYLPSYASNPRAGGWSTSCVSQLGPLFVRDANSGISIKRKSVEILIEKNATEQSYQRAVAHAWAHAEAASWGEKGYAYNMQWLRLIGYQPVTRDEYWTTSVAHALRPSELWAEGRARCTADLSTIKVTHPVACDKVDALVHYINNYKGQ